MGTRVHLKSTNPFGELVIVVPNRTGQRIPVTDVWVVSRSLYRAVNQYRSRGVMARTLMQRQATSCETRPIHSATT